MQTNCYGNNMHCCVSKPCTHHTRDIVASGQLTVQEMPGPVITATKYECDQTLLRARVWPVRLVCTALGPWKWN